LLSTRRILSPGAAAAMLAPQTHPVASAATGGPLPPPRVGWRAGAAALGASLLAQPTRREPSAWGLGFRLNARRTWTSTASHLPPPTAPRPPAPSSRGPWKLSHDSRPPRQAVEKQFGLATPETIFGHHGATGCYMCPRAAAHGVVGEGGRGGGR
jgi:hypothetical protein